VGIRKPSKTQFHTSDTSILLQTFLQKIWVVGPQVIVKMYHLFVYYFHDRTIVIWKPINVTGSIKAFGRASSYAGETSQTGVTIILDIVHHMLPKENVP